MGREAPGIPVGILCALPAELGSLPERAVGSRTVQGLEILELDLDGAPALACVGGVGKVMAARAASLLIAEGAARALLVVGVCGGLRSHLVPGTLVHCTTAAQVDFASRPGREVVADADWRGRWQAVAPGEEGWFLTADRPCLSIWRRIRLARAFAGPCVADMETAAAGAVARAAGVPWAGLRAVTDPANELGPGLFRLHFRTQAGRAADSVLPLLAKV